MREGSTPKRGAADAADAADGRQVAPYGSWATPLDLDTVVAGAISLADCRYDGQDLYWLEGRPAEAGRQVIVRLRPGSAPEDVTPPRYNVRSRVHEYGGGGYAVAHGVVYFSNLSDGRIHRQRSAGPPEAITPEGPFRYADLQVDASRSRLLCVREDHSGPGEPVNTLVAVPLAEPAGGGAEPVRVLVSGADFYSSPRVSRDGTRLAWLSWDHPDMPWDGSELWLAAIGEDGGLEGARRIAGGRDESIAQPEWSPTGELYFVSDRSGWWNLYRGTDARDPVAPMEAEFAEPAWVFGNSSYCVDGEGRLVCSARSDGRDTLLLIEPDGGIRTLDVPYDEVAYVRPGVRGAVFIGSGPAQPPSVVALDLPGGESRVLRRAFELPVASEYVADPESISFPSTLGTAYALYYPPTNPDFRAPDGARPPLLVRSHGGPTSNASRALSLGTQAFTSRGFGVLDVDYGGSTGYGRAYRQRLEGGWGVVDVDDCIAGARYLVERGDADPAQVAVRGGSAGGYTTLCAVTFHDFFRAGASYYGIADLETMVRDTHKFESRYLDRLVGPYPERRDLYVARSPIHFTDRLSCPLILFQGLDDKVVLPNQAETMVTALRAKAIPFAYLAFEGEDHGFRKAENIRRALEAELSFYGRIFGFEPAGDLQPVPIENLPDGT